MNKNIFPLKLITILLCISMVSCTNSRQNQPLPGDISYGDPTTGTPLQTKLTTKDYRTFGEEIANKVLTSRVARKWGNPKRPKLILGEFVNNTDNEGLDLQLLTDSIQEAYFGSGLVRIVGSGSLHYDYVLHGYVTSNRQRHRDGRELVTFTVQYKLSDDSGELLGQWSYDIKMQKAARSYW